MATYKYKAVNEQGKFLRGNMEAANEVDLELRLQRIGLDLVTYRVKENFSLFGRRRTVQQQDLINFSFHLEQLVRAGIPLIDALKDVRDAVGTSQFQSVVSQIIEGIEGGKRFSYMLDQFPHIFGRIYASMVRVGESSGRLAEVLKDLAEMSKWQDEIVTRLKRAMVYPAFATVVIFAVILFIMLWLVPNLTKFVAGVGYELPWHTQMLFGVSNAFVNYWFIILFVPILITISVLYLLKYSTNFKRKWDGWLLRVWLVGPVLLRVKLARFSNYAAMMYTSGISVLDLIQLGRQIVENESLDRALEKVHMDISNGLSISESFEAAGIFPPLISRMMRIGETSGALDTAFHQVSYFYSREADNAIAKLEQFVGPVMIIPIGVLMLWVITSVIGPLYEAIIEVGASL